MQYIDGDMVELQRALFKDIGDERKWMGFMYEVTNVIGSGKCESEILQWFQFTVCQ